MSSAINAIITVIDVHVEKWEKDNLKDKTKTKTRNKTHDNAQDKKQDKKLDKMQEETQKEVQEIQSPNKIDFVTVKKRTNGKDTLHVFVNGVRFNCAKTNKVTGKKYFICS